MGHCHLAFHWWKVTRTALHCISSYNEKQSIHTTQLRGPEHQLPDPSPSRRVPRTLGKGSKKRKGARRDLPVLKKPLLTHLNAMPHVHAPSGASFRIHQHPLVILGPP